MVSNGFCCNSPEALRKCASILCSNVPYPMPGRISVDKKSRLTEVACTGLSYHHVVVNLMPTQPGLAASTWLVTKFFIPLVLITLGCKKRIIPGTEAHV